MKVMVVEDEALIAMILEDMLVDLGCEVIGPFGGVTPAMDWLEDPGHAPDAAVLDVNLGGERVFPVAEALRTRGVPFLFATGYGVIEDDRFANETVLNKPLDPDKLAAAVDRLRAA
jgi:two-component SAPR family response regulator